MSGKKSRQRGAKNNQADYKKDPASADREKDYDKPIDPTIHIPIAPGYNSHKTMAEQEAEQSRYSEDVIKWASENNLPIPTINNTLETKQRNRTKKRGYEISTRHGKFIGCIGNCFNRKPYIEE